MTEKILLSEILATPSLGSMDAFISAVNTHIDNLDAWHAHHDDKPADHPHRYPAPDPHLLVRRAVVRLGGGNHAPDYEVIDDVSGPTFERKKQTLFSLIAQTEADESAKIMPVGKRRAWNLRMADLNAAEAKTAHDSNLPLADVVKNRIPDDSAFVKDYEARQASLDKLIRHGAQLMSEVEDLTPETIDSWKPSPLKE